MTQCPVCKHELTATDRTYSINEIFAGWAKVAVPYPDEIIALHRAQSEKTTLHTCPNCELGIFLPMVVGTPEFYQNLGKHTQHVYELQDRWEFDEALQDVKGMQSVIEIGSGNGVFLGRAQNVVKEVIGLEYNPDAVAFIRSKNLTVYGLDEEAQLASRKGTFDGAFSFQVLEHVTEPLDFARNCASWVRPGGKIGLCVPNAGSIIRHYTDDVYNLPPHHTTHWTEKTLRTLAKELDLEVERISYQPLYAQHFDYLATWWDNIISKNSTGISKMLHLGGKGVVVGSYQTLRKLGVKRLPIRGHSIYILMRKR